MEIDYTRILNWFKKNIGFIVIFAILVVRILTSFITINPSDKSILAIIGDCLFNGALMFIVGLLMNKQGQITGLASDEIQKTLANHREVCEKIIPISSGLPSWCMERNTRDLDDIRKTILSNEDIKWEEFLAKRYAVSRLVTVREKTPDGKTVKTRKAVTEIVDEGALKGRKKKAVKRARRAKITPLTSAMLTTTLRVRTSDPHRMGRSIATYDVQKTGSNIFMKVAFAVLLGGFVPVFIEGVTPAEVIWSGVCVVIYAAQGVLSYMDAKSFITTEYRENFEIKIRYLKEYEIHVAAHGLVSAKTENKEINTENTTTERRLVPVTDGAVAIGGQ